MRSSEIFIIKNNNWPYFDLKGTKEDVQRQIVDLMEQGEIKNLTDLRDIVMKSYYMVDLYDNQHNLESFFKDYILKEQSNERIESGKFLQLFCNFFFDSLESMTGDYLLWNGIISVNSTLKGIACKVLKERGYQNSSYMSKFFVRQQPNKDPIEIREKDQRYLLTTYKTIVDEYVNLTKNIIESEYWLNMYLTLNAFVENIDKRLTEESKKSSIYIVYNKKVVSINELYNTKQQNAYNYSYYKNLKAAITRCKHNQQTKDDKDLINDFLTRAAEAIKLCSIQDENGHIHKANFFTSVPMVPKHALIIIRGLDGLKLNEEDKKIVGDFRRFINMNYNTQRPVDDMKSPTTQILHYLQGKISSKNIVVDLSNGESFHNFCEKVDNYIDKHNLPNFRDCIEIVANGLIRGEEPIYIPKNSNKAEDSERII